MKMTKIFGIMFAMMLLVLTFVSATPLEIGVPDIEYITQGDNLTLNPYVYDDTGLLVVAPCNYKLNDEVIGANTLMNTTGEFTLDVWCSTNEIGGYYTDDFIVTKETKFGLWTPVEDWTFPIVYLVITFLIIMFAIAYEASIVGVLGSLMLIFSYFLVGARSPILFTPLLIIGFLLAFKFGTS
jgi:hypothetical protein